MCRVSNVTTWGAPAANPISFPMCRDPAGALNGGPHASVDAGRPIGTGPKLKVRSNSVATTQRDLEWRGPPGYEMFEWRRTWLDVDADANVDTAVAAVPVMICAPPYRSAARR